MQSVDRRHVLLSRWSVTIWWPSSCSDALVPSSFFFPVVRPGAPFVASLFRPGLAELWPSEEAMRREEAPEKTEEMREDRDRGARLGL